MPWNAIGKPLLDLIGDPSVFVAVVIGLWVVTWWFREIKTSITTHRDQTVSRLDKTLEVYGELETRMLIHLRNKNSESENELFKLVGKSYPYLSPYLYEQISFYIRYRDIDLLERCLGIIQEEVPELRVQYRGNIPELHDTLEKIPVYLVVIGKIMTPIGVTFLSIVAVLSLFLTMTYIGILPTWGEKTGVIFNMMGTILFLLMGYLFISDKKLWARARGTGVLITFSFLLVYISHDWFVKLIILSGITSTIIYLAKRREKKVQVPPQKGIYM